MADINNSGTVKQIKAGVNSLITMDSFRAAIIDGNAYKVGFADVTGINPATTYLYYVKNTSLTKSVWLRPIDFSTGTLLVQIVKNGIFKLGGTVYNPADYTDMVNAGTVTAGSPYITGTFDLDYVKVGMSITGFGIPDNTFVWVDDTSRLTMVDVNASPVLATASATNEAIVISVPTLLARNLNTNSANQASAKMWFQSAAILGGAVTWGDTASDKILKTVDYEMAQPSSLAETMSIIKPQDSFMVALTNYGDAKIPYRISVEWSEI